MARRQSVAIDNGGPMIGGLKIANVEFVVF